MAKFEHELSANPVYYCSNLNLSVMKFSLFTLLFVCITSFLFAQKNPVIKEETKANSNGSFNALTIEMPGTSAKEVSKVWSRFVKKYKGRYKYEKKTNEHFLDDATIKKMSENTVDVTMKVEERGNEGAVVSVWFNLGVSYLSSKDFGDRYPAGEQFLMDFAKDVTSDMIEEELKAAEKLLKDLEDQLKKLEKDKNGLEKDIVNYEETIKKMENNIKEANEDIKENEEAQVKSTAEIEAQVKVVDEIKARLENVKK